MLRENSELTMKSDILIESVNFCLFKCIFLFICINFSYGNHLNNTTTRNEFVNQCRRDCIIKRDPVGCGKYRIVKWLHEVVLEKVNTFLLYFLSILWTSVKVKLHGYGWLLFVIDFIFMFENIVSINLMIFIFWQELSYGPFRVIKIPATTQNPIFPEIPKTRDLKFQFSETLNFFRNIGDDFIRRRAVVYTLIPSPKNFRSFESGPVIVDEDELARIQKEDAGKFILALNWIDSFIFLYFFVDIIELHCCE